VVVIVVVVHSTLAAAAAAVADHCFILRLDSPLRQQFVGK
jgi:hypothetical protein